MKIKVAHMTKPMTSAKKMTSKGSVAAKTITKATKC